MCQYNREKCKYILQGMMHAGDKDDNKEEKDYSEQAEICSEDWDRFSKR